MTNAQGNTEQAGGRAVPLTVDGDEGLSIGHVEPGRFLFISAQNTGRFGTVTCRITINGSTVSTATSQGAFVIAACDGVVP